MKRQKTLPISQNDWDYLPLDIQLYITAKIFLAVEFPRLTEMVLNLFYRVDLWLFPPLAFTSTYFLTARYFPAHPIKIFAVLSTAFMFSTLTLFLIRPPKRRQYHWIKE